MRSRCSILVVILTVACLSIDSTRGDEQPDFHFIEFYHRPERGFGIVLENKEYTKSVESIPSGKILELRRRWPDQVIKDRAAEYRTKLKEQLERNEIANPDDPNTDVYRKAREIKRNELQTLIRNADTSPEVVSVGLDRIDESSEEKVIEKIGIVPYFSWITKKTLPVACAGKVIKTDGLDIYTTIGANQKARSGQGLFVYRGTSEIKNPDTGEVLGKERRKIASLELTDVKEKFSIARLVGTFNVQLEAGDVVEADLKRASVAVLPLVTPTATLAVYGNSMAEELTTELAKQGISVVERALLKTALSEIKLQERPEFDKEAARKFGKQVGATYVVAGTFFDKGVDSDYFRCAEVNMRLVNVETGEIVLSRSTKGQQLYYSGRPQRSKQ